VTIHKFFRDSDLCVCVCECVSACIYNHECVGGNVWISIFMHKFNACGGLTVTIHNFFVILIFVYVCVCVCVCVCMCMCVYIQS